MEILAVSFAPILIIAFYIYFRDKYEKEPIGMLLWSFILGAFITAPIIVVEGFLDDIWKAKYEPHHTNLLANAAYVAFVVASLTEETFKYIAFLLIWNNKNFNEKFDGIVYAVFISLGFAAVENVLYVVQNGLGTGVMRAFTAVPAHALFGISMGYYFGLAKFEENKKVLRLLLALAVPLLLHGIYDFILFSENTILLLLFIPFIIGMWYLGFRKMKAQSQASVFKSDDTQVV